MVRLGLTDTEGWSRHTFEVWFSFEFGADGLRLARGIGIKVSSI